MGNARKAALFALHSCHAEGGWSEVALRRELAKEKLDGRDAALASRLCYGVLQNQLYLDFLLGNFCARKLDQLEPKVLEALRLGAYQLLFLDKVPPMAAVNESVELAKRWGKNPKAAGLVNAVLRNLDRSRNDLPEPGGSPLERLSVRTSHPLWLTEEFAGLVGEEELPALLEADNREVPVTAQVNTTRCTAETLADRLVGRGMGVTPHPWLPDCLILEKTGDLTALAEFREGLFYIQDPAARLAVWAASPKAGEKVLDLCAAPGGKSFAAAIAMKNTGSVISRDLYPRKVERLREDAARLGLSRIQCGVGDATGGEDGPDYDLVIADVPCSGLGIIRKKPEIRYKDPAEFAGLLPVQETILDRAAGAVKPGGRLLYATCTVRREENEGQVARFLAGHGDFHPLPLDLPEPLGRIEGGAVTLWPHRHGTDGFFFALLGKEGKA